MILNARENIKRRLRAEPRKAAGRIANTNRLSAHLL